MRQLITEIRQVMPCGRQDTDLCQTDCRGCSKKLLDYLDAELLHWQSRLDAGDIPNFGDLAALARTARKIHAVLVRNKVLRTA